MTPKRIADKEIFNIARLIDSHVAVSDYLNQVCGQDDEQRNRIAQLLTSNKSDSFLEKPPFPLPETITSRSPTETAGQSIGEYKLLQVIGEGGMGTVYMAEQQQPVRRRVALKIIKPGMDSTVVVARFESERQALAMMDHPNISKVLGAGTTDSGRPYFVMELVKGVPITEYCDDQKLPIRERLKLFIQVCEAIQHAHQKGIIHRDVKPSNVLVARYDDRPVPKIIDFGVAKATNQRLTEKTMFTQYGQIVGTLEYMSPEQAQFNQLDVDTRSDIYSLGVLLYELLTGETPFDRKRLCSSAFDEVLRIIREEEPPRPSNRVSTLGDKAKKVSSSRSSEPTKLGPFLRGDLDWVVMKAMEKDRGRRYETANALAVDIQRHISDEPVYARPPSVGYRTRKLLKRNMVVATTMSLVLTSLLVGLVATAWYAHQSRVNALAAESAQAEAEGERQRAETRARELETTLGIVKDYTMLLAQSGDSRDLDLALQISEVAKTSEVWNLMLRAQSALEQGKPNQAIQYLRLGLDQEDDPDLLACKGLLGLAYCLAGDTDNLRSIHRELKSSDPQSPEEFLFVGQGLQMDSKKWWDMANRAIEKRGSLTAKLNRARAAVNYALDIGDITIAEQGIDDIMTFQGSMAQTSYFICARLSLYMTAMHLAEINEPSVDKWRTAAEDDLKKLEAHSDDGWALLVRAWYLDSFGSSDAADLAWKTVLEKGAGGWHDTHAAGMVFRQGDVEKGREYLTGEDTLEQTALASVLAAHRDTRAEANGIYDQIKANRTTINFRSGTGFEIPLIAGDLEKTREDAEVLLAGESSVFLTPFDKSMVEFLAGKIALKAFEKQLTSFNRTEQLMAHFLVGLRAYAKDDLKLARTHFKKCRDTGVFHTSDFYWAKAYLTLLDEESKDE